MAGHGFLELEKKLTTLSQLKDFGDFDQSIIKEIFKEVRKVCREADRLTSKANEDLLEEARGNLVRQFIEREQQLVKQLDEEKAKLRACRRELDEEKNKLGATEATHPVALRSLVAKATPDADAAENDAAWASAFKEFKHRLYDLRLSQGGNIPVIDLFPRMCDIVFDDSKYCNLLDFLDHAELSISMCLSMLEVGDQVVVDGKCPYHPDGCLRVTVVKENGLRTLTLEGKCI
ncbi:hypothetical protein NM208_g9051 [Fusarium decemcellulare]|uniref:Uncharacterized protein n=1 Tax=Fusarium decemcellulare TaxID=57161 RepID=A0ACC1S338_9HYPO|nr:hypothetical protein NM208_g9051 [Fusarium decemcellulare]